MLVDLWGVYGWMCSYFIVYTHQILKNKEELKEYFLANKVQSAGIVRPVKEILFLSVPS